MHLSGIQQSVDFTKDALDDLVKSEEPTKELEKDMKPDGKFRSLELAPTAHQITECKNLLQKYVEGLNINMDDRFESEIPVLSAFDIYNPLLVPERHTPSFKEYGVDKIYTLAHHFYLGEQKQQLSDELVASWGHFKYELLKYNTLIPDEILASKRLTSVTPTE